MDYWIKGKGVDEPIETNLQKNIEVYEETKRIWLACKDAPDDGVKKKLADNERKQIAKERAYKNLRYEVK